MCLICLKTLSAQSLPNIQTQSVRLPADTKIDGKLSEWPEFLQAYNKATRLEYTMANDDKKLYLAIRSKDKSTTSKILLGGISFSLGTSNTAYKDTVITLPATNSAYTYSPEGRRTANFKISSGTAEILNSIEQLKEIKVLRFKGIQDSILSIYNKYGISSKLAYFNETLVLELAIPLDLIGINKDPGRYYEE